MAATPLRQPAFDSELEKLAAELDLDLLREVGWNPTTGRIDPPPAHRLLGYADCEIEGCANVAPRGKDLCSACAERYRRAKKEDSGLELETFIAATAKAIRRTAHDEPLCLVCRAPGYERPARASGLCSQCNSQRIHREQSVEAFLAGDDRWGPGRPKPSFGLCDVFGCERLAMTGQGLCTRHDPAWRRAGRPRGADRASFLATEARRLPLSAVPRHPKGRDGLVSASVVAARGVNLAPFSERTRLEVLLGVQRSIERGRRLRPDALASACRLLARRRSETTLDLERLYEISNPPVRNFLRLTKEEVGRTLADPELEFEGELWDLKVFGHTGTLDFRELRQPWLRDAGKRWSREKLAIVHRRSVDRVVDALRFLSRHLAGRDDAGEDPAALDRPSMLAFLAYMGHLEATGEATRWQRMISVRSLGQFLRESRQQGLADPGGPLALLKPTFAVTEADTKPFSGIRREGRRDLPEAVMAQLLDPAALELLGELRGETTRALVEIHAETGRRPAESCELRLGCLDYDSPHEPVIVCDLPKSKIEDYRLPITVELAAVVAAQQKRVRVAFPGAPESELPLFPRPALNREGRHPLRAQDLANALREWREALPELLGPDGAPYPRERVVPYAFRHTFAQRHADAGTPIEVLADLMGHRDTKTTQVYYEVADKRKRLAVDSLSPLQLNATGERQLPLVERLIESERTRREVGQVAIPFGACTEPSNVRAGGHVCPFRFRCTGCEFFRTDPSYLPELREHLAQLLRDRERLAARAPELAEWARASALPAEEEIAAVRRLVRRCEELLGEVPDEERTAIEEAIAVLRRSRAQLPTAMPGARRLAVRQVSPSLNPRTAKEDR